MKSYNAEVLITKYELLLKIIPLKLKEFDELKDKNADTKEIEAEIFGLMQAFELFRFAISNVQNDEKLKEECIRLWRMASDPLYGRCPDGKSETFREEFEMIRKHYNNIVDMKLNEVLKKLDEID